MQIIAPASWSENASLHPDASIALSNNFADKHLLILADSKEELDGSFDYPQYVDFVESNLFSELTDAIVSKHVQLTIDGRLSTQFTMQGKVDGQSISYLVTVTESPTHFYQIVCLTQTRKFDRLHDEFKQITASFHEMPAPATRK